jgi:alkane 1-monooxygenase
MTKGPRRQQEDVMIWFVIASLSPMLLMITAAVLGGLWAWVALVYMTVCVYLVDRKVQRLEIASDARNLRFANWLSVVLALGHVGVLLLCLYFIPRLTLWEMVVTAITLGLFMGQISHPNAHELIHHGNRWMRRLGVLVYSTMLIGHHVSAHLRVHHVHVATPEDPNSARRGEGFYRFWARAWWGSLVKGLAEETRIRALRADRASVLTHPYLVYVATAAGMLALAVAQSGQAGVIVLLAACGYAHMQIFLADYVQHYGLQRRPGATGKPEPVGPQHSWNAPHWFSSAMMLNAPRHSDHHMNPKRRFPDLELNDDMPTWPHALPMMAVLALAPRVWRRVMDRRVDAQRSVVDP